ncbi:hypothetical protein H072_6700 [Dactylellina haptotyla CBS 200.50]|uniref:N-acetyltransferase domain-containing protein n=1 Tax=Dactylellina haptotyla (strain CBS 200.50) TaxID=1284197 RepID=S8BJQ0_DACHA|nr:hypothetical protein H072_6700 [Dactylellina haptotyla CBS 200.50]
MASPAVSAVSAAAVGQSQITLKITTQHNAHPGLTDRLMDIVTAAFAEDQSFCWRYPERKKYPAHDRHLYWRYLGAELLDPSVYVVVAYLNDNGKEVPVGYSTWERRGDGKKAEAKTRDSWLQRSERYLFTLQERVYSTLFPNPAAYQPAIDLMRQSFASTDEELAALPGFEKYLHLNILVVDPSYQRRGIGEALVKWGVEKVKRENMPAALEASRAGKRVYSKCGFQELKIIDAFHPSEDRPWVEGMHCHEQGCAFAMGTVMTFQPSS